MATDISIPTGIPPEWATDVDAGTSPCKRCGAVLPREQLVLPTVCFGKKEPVCPVCNEQIKQEWIIHCADMQASKSTQSRMGRVQRFVELAREDGAKAAPTIHRVLSAVVDELGGVERMAAMWGENIKSACMESPGSQKALKAFNDLAKLLAAATPRMETTEDLSTLSDEELQQKESIETTRMVVLKIMEKCPSAAEELEKFLLGSDTDIDESEAPAD